MDKWACNSTCLTASKDILGIANVTLTLLWMLKLSLLGVIYDKSVAFEVSQLMPKLMNTSNAVLYLADDIIRDETTARSYLKFVSSHGIKSRGPVSLVITQNINIAANVFNTLSRSQSWLGSQNGVGLYTKWLVLTPDNNTAILERSLGDFYNVAVTAPSTGSSEATESMKILIKTLIVKPEGKRLETVGDSIGGNLSLWAPVFPNINRGFNQMHLKIGVYVWPPFTWRITRNGGITYEGFCVDLIIELSRRLNFSFTMVEPEDNQWGAPLPDGGWTGVVGMIQKHEIDASVAALMITPERAKVMDASFPFYYDNFAVLYKRPDPKENLWKTYLNPFQTQVYVSLGASIVGASVLFVLLALLSPRSATQRALKRRKWLRVISHSQTLTSWLIYALIHQSQRYLPNFGPGRVFLAFWWIFAILLAATYKGNLMAFLLVAKSDQPFTTLWDLSTQNVYKWGVTGSTVVEYLFKISNRSDFRKLGEGLEVFKALDPETNSTDPDVHLRKVKAGGYAYISDQVPMEMWVALDCDLRILDERVIPLPFIVGLHNNSAYVTAFNEQILDIDQIGLYNQWKSHWWPMEGQCSENSAHDSRALTLLETQAAFYILCIGMSIAVVALVAEYMRTGEFFILFRRNISDIWCGNEF